MFNKTHTRLQRATILRRAACDWLIRQKYAASQELGLVAWGRRKADVVANSVRGDLIIVEIKSCHADLTTDRKWRSYLPFCDKFYFCFGADHWLARETEIRTIVKGTGAGVLVLDPRGYCMVKIPARKMAIEPNVRMAIMARLAWRNADFNAARNRRTRRMIIEAEFGDL